MRLIGVGIAAVGLVAFLAPATAVAQEACSCRANDAANAVELEVTGSAPVPHSSIGADQETPVVDLRGEGTALVGDAPQLLEGVDLAEVPVLMAVVSDAADPDCNQAQPPSGATLSITGHAYLEETGPVVWTGVCQGELTVVTAAEEPSGSTDDDPWGRGLAIATVCLAALALGLLAFVLLTGRSTDPTDDGHRSS